MNSTKRKRIWRETQDVNADFFNLRTVIVPASDDDLSQFYFIMSPNDGCMAHMKVAGCLYIPNTYPESPPVVHLYTKTGRYNVDVYSGYLGDRTRSTLCFDILRSEANGGAWKPEYSISTLFASLMSAIVSFYVPQQSGGEIAEYVSMEKLERVKKAAQETHEQYKHLLPILPEIPLVEATAVSAKQLSFPSPITSGDVTKTTAGPIYLQSPYSNIHSFAMDLSELHAGVVFSVILSNSETDLEGKKSGTILVRNGVTATAARKRANEKTKWFYHGKPMNDGDMRLHVTIGRDQMTFAYYSNGRHYVHGDCPVSRLTESQIGDVRGIPFYIHVYLRRKSGEPVGVIWLDTEGKGCIHAAMDQMAETNEGSDNDFGFELVDNWEAAEDMKQSEEQKDLLAHMGELSLNDKGGPVKERNTDKELHTSN
ncbi:hypothetical protein F4802DRAFT_611893 [Xylaria palmicola]|nr:hypothetical protein F4802DRAFT_611893 [Xylaria palmicola]